MKKIPPPRNQAAPAGAAHDVPHPKRLLRLLYKFLLISLVIHGIALLVFGSVILISKMIPDEVTFEAPVEVKRVEPKERVYKLQAKEQQERSARPKLQQRLQSTQTSPIALPSIDAKVAPVKTTVSDIPGMSEGLGEGLDFDNQVGAAQIFGVEIAARRLGVALDVSFSTHSLIHTAIKEIEKAFPDAILGFVPGCGMGNVRKSLIVPLADYEKHEDDFTMPRFTGPQFHTTAFVSRLMQSNQDFQQIWRKAERQNRGHILLLDLEIRKDREGEERIGAVHGTHLMLEFLTEQDVDAIYWFADFNDGIDRKLADDTVRLLRRKGIKLYMHDFVPPAGPLPNESGETDPARLKLLEEMAEATRGEFFLKEL